MSCILVVYEQAYLTGVKRIGVDHGVVVRCKRVFENSVMYNVGPVHRFAGRVISHRRWMTRHTERQKLGGSAVSCVHLVDV